MPIRPGITPMSAGAERARSLLGAPVRLQVLRFLLSNPQQSRTQLVERTGIALPTVRQAIAHLQEAGYLDLDGSYPVRYSANRARVAEDTAALQVWLLS